MPEIPFFDYIEINLPNALCLFKNNYENAFLGVATGSVIEFLGRCLCPHDSNTHEKKSDGNQDHFKAFIRNYLSKQNLGYDLHWEILYKDLRHGSAHTTLTYGGVRLSVTKEDAHHHLTLFPWGEDNISLLVYSPEFIDDLIASINQFSKDVKANQDLQTYCEKAVKSIEKHGQNLIQKIYPGIKFVPIPYTTSTIGSSGLTI